MPKIPDVIATPKKLLAGRKTNAAENGRPANTQYLMKVRRFRNLFINKVTKRAAKARQRMLAEIIINNELLVKPICKNLKAPRYQRKAFATKKVPTIAFFGSEPSFLLIGLNGIFIREISI